MRGLDWARWIAKAGVLASLPLLPSCRGFVPARDRLRVALSEATPAADELDAALTSQGTELQGTLLLTATNETRLNIRMNRR